MWVAIFDSMAMLVRSSGLSQCGKALARSQRRTVDNLAEVGKARFNRPFRYASLVLIVIMCCTLVSAMAHPSQYLMPSWIKCLVADVFGAVARQRMHA